MSLKENCPTYKPLPIKLDLKWSEHLPQLVWRGYFLSEVRPSVQQPIVRLDHLHFAEALEAAFIQLSYVQFLKCIGFIKSLPVEFELEKVALEAHSNFRWNEESENLLSLLNAAPETFTHWVIEKKMAFNDLRPLLRAETHRLGPHLEKLAELNPSKSFGTALLESLCDLSDGTLIGQVPLDSIQSSKQWLDDLTKAKNPKTSAKDIQRQAAVRSWPWPPRTSGKWKRWGDQAGLEVQLNCINPKDLKLKIEKLSEIAKKWQDELL